MAENKNIEIKGTSLPLWAVVLISFLNAFIGYLMIAAVHGICFSLFFAAIFFILSFVSLPFVSLVPKLWKLRKEVAKIFGP